MLRLWCMGSGWQVDNVITSRAELETLTTGQLTSVLYADIATVGGSAQNTAPTAEQEWTVNDMRLIDAEALLEELNNLEPLCANKFVKQGLDDGLHYYMPKILETQPTIDAVPVVRCKDCKHWGGVVFGNVCRRWSAPLAGMRNDTKPDDFCSYGERKDGDG